MDQFFSSLPKPLLAIGAILIGFLLIRLNDPPRTVCDVQMEIFRDSQKTFLYKQSKTELGQPSRVNQLYDLCVSETGPGGCFELFEGLKKLNADLRNIPYECSERAGSETEIKKWLTDSMKLMVRIAWGERMPAAHTLKNGWFDASELALFCDMKKSWVKMYGNEAYTVWREDLIKTLPKSDQLAREQVWQRSLLSTPCDSFR
jgi:hypothetical protein